MERTQHEQAESGLSGWQSAIGRRVRLTWRNCYNTLSRK
jgi:hypothetical protein